MHVPLTVHDHLDRASLVYGSRTGVVDEPDQPAPPLGTLTYAELADRAREQAAAWDRLGLERGDRIAIVSHNSARMLVALWSVCAWGRVLVPINFRLGREEIRYIVEHSGARVLLVDPDLADDLAGIEVEHTFVLGRDDEQLTVPDGAPVDWEGDETATATINYTSGTTAKPKGVQLTHRSLWLNAATLGWHAGISDRDVYLHTLPLFHVNGWGVPFALAAMGVPQIVLRKVDGDEILRRVRDHGVTLLCGAPAVVATVLDAAKDWGEVPGRGRVRILVAGAPPPSTTIERVETELGWEFMQLYGLTETSPLLTVNRSREEWDALSPRERAEKLMRAGAPALGVQLRIDGDGQVLARGNHALASYWQQPDASAEALRDGWFRTGDGGVLDHEGYLTIVDRKKDVIITGGENVSSVEVERALASHPAVFEAAVVAAPDPKWGEVPVAYVQLRDLESASEQELIAYARDHLAHFKAPKRVFFRDLPRTSTGKVMKHELRRSQDGATENDT